MPKDAGSRHDRTLQETARTITPQGHGAGERAPLLATELIDGRYRVVDELGVGGMGEVLLCRDERLWREVAVKRVKRQVTSADVTMRRFLREARLQACLEHPAIVPLYDAGLADARPYFVMKRVRGTTMKSLIEALDDGGGAHAVRARLLAALSTVCQAVDYAHSCGVVHRDLKPTNIMLGDFGEVYVLDWGIAKLLEQADEAPDPAAGNATGDGITETGALLGTLGYMPPEQAKGELDEVDARADVYALGAVLFEIITGTNLHSGSPVDRALSTLRGADVAEALAKVAAPELVAICTKATSTDPDKRYAAVREMRADVERYLAGERDAERRRQQSALHTQQALAAADNAIADIPETEASEARRRAMRELSRALALDPDNHEAMRTLVRLLTEPPRDIPAAVRERVAESERRMLHGMVTTTAGGYGLLFAFLPLVVWAGVRSWSWLAVLVALGLACNGFAYSMGRRPAASSMAMWPMLVCNTLLMGAVCTLLGPFILVPMLVTLTTFAFVLRFGSRSALGPTVLGCLAVVVPAGVQLAGLMPASYSFEAGTMRVLPIAIELARAPVLTLLALGCTATIIFGAIFAARFRAILSHAELQLHLRSWQLEQLVDAD